MSEPFLKVENVETYYGSIRALAGVDFAVNSGEIVTMIGANGAGKSTLMMTICGNPQAAHRPHRSSTAATSPTCPRTRSCASASRSRRKGAASSRA